MSNDLRQINKQRHLKTLEMYMPFLLPAFQMLIQYLVSISQIISGKYSLFVLSQSLNVHFYFF